MATPIDLPAFARLHDVRAPRIAWLFGAGTSAAAGIATAGQMTWEFKALLYATEKSISLSALDLGDPIVRKRIQSHFNSDPSCPPDESDDEYSFYFERAYPKAADRRAYLDRAIASGQPGYGHSALAALMSLGKVGVVWTTNFDRVIEDAAAKILGTTRTLTVATLDTADIAAEALNDQRLPLYVKIHGDFQSERLKNLNSEVLDQDAKLRDALRMSAARFGMAVVGYSGRDASVMEALRNGLKEPSPYPHGLYWFARGSDDPLPAVATFIADARAGGVDAHLIRFETFDELFGVLLTPITLPPDLAKSLEAMRPPVRTTPFRMPTSSRTGFPVIRLNALEVEQYPLTARRIECDIGGTGDVKKAVESAGAKAVAHRRNDGVIAFGSDAELHRVFDSYRITAWDIAPLEPLGGRTSDAGLLYDALAAALARERPLLVQHHGRVLTVDPAQAGDDALKAVKAAARELSGTIPGTGLPWAEAVEVQLEVQHGRIWLVFEPTIWAAIPKDDRVRATRAAFIKERRARRYNQIANSLLDAWAKLLGNDDPLSSFGLSPDEGMDAAFKVSATTAFARGGA